MSVLLETSRGDLVVDLHVDHAPRACLNFLKLCKLKYYNGCLFHFVQKGRLVQTGDPTGTGAGGSSVWGVLHGERARFFGDELGKSLSHDRIGTVSMATAGPGTNASQFLITTGTGLGGRLDETHTIFGQVAEGLDTLDAIDSAYCDAEGRPYQNIRIKHTILLDDPFPDPDGLRPPDRSPSPTADQLRQDKERLADDEALDEHEGKSAEELEEALAAQAAKSRAEVLEMLGDLPDADIAPPENVLFVCKLNPVTQDEDLEIIFSRFGDIKKCEVIRDARTGDSLNYAFVEYASKEQSEAAYLKMDGALIDDRRIRVDFSQSVAKVWNRYRRNEPMGALAAAPGQRGPGAAAGPGGAGAGGRGHGRAGGLQGGLSGAGGRGGLQGGAGRWGGAQSAGGGLQGARQALGAGLVFDVHAQPQAQQPPALPRPPPPPPHAQPSRPRASRWGDGPSAAAPHPAVAAPRPEADARAAGRPAEQGEGRHERERAHPAKRSRSRSAERGYGAGRDERGERGADRARERERDREHGRERERDGAERDKGDKHQRRREDKPPHKHHKHHKGDKAHKSDKRHQ